MKTTLRKELMKMADPECEGPVTSLAYDQIRWDALANVLAKIINPEPVKQQYRLDEEFDVLPLDKSG